jgi:AmmeMemoRadiSam system protein B
VPIALGTLDFDALTTIGNSLGQILARDKDVLLLTTTDLNHYENQSATVRKDNLAIEKILALDPAGLYEICRKEKISMCGLGSTVAMLSALRHAGVSSADLVRHTTSAIIPATPEKS